MTTQGQWIRDNRKRLGLSQAGLAARVGSNQAYVSQWETGKRGPSGDELVRLKDLLGGEPPAFAPASAAAPSGGGRSQPQAFALSMDEFEAMGRRRGRPPASQAVPPPPAPVVPVASPTPIIRRRRDQAPVTLTPPPAAPTAKG